MKSAVLALFATIALVSATKPFKQNPLHAKVRQILKPDNGKGRMGEMDLLNTLREHVKNDKADEFTTGSVSSLCAGIKETLLAGDVYNQQPEGGVGGEVYASSCCIGETKNLYNEFSYVECTIEPGVTLMAAWLSDNYVSPTNYEDICPTLQNIGVGWSAIGFELTQYNYDLSSSSYHAVTAGDCAACDADQCAGSIQANEVVYELHDGQFGGNYGSGKTTGAYANLEANLCLYKGVVQTTYTCGVVEPSTNYDAYPTFDSNYDYAPTYDRYEPSYDRYPPTFDSYSPPTFDQYSPPTYDNFDGTTQSPPGYNPYYGDYKVEEHRGAAGKSGKRARKAAAHKRQPRRKH